MSTFTGGGGAGASTGAIDVSIASNYPPYTYTWGGGQTSQDISGLPAGSYALTVTERSPDFALEAAADRLTMAPGKQATLGLKVVRCDGFDRPIVLECPGLPAGVRLNPGMSQPKGKSAEEITLTFEAAPGAAAFSGPIQVHGRAGDLSHPATWPVPRLDRTSIDKLWLTVLPTPK